jgi:hypothetical protein
METRPDTVADRDRAESDSVGEFAVLQSIITALQSISPEARRRIIDAAATFLKIEGTRSGSRWQEMRSFGDSYNAQSISSVRPPFSGDTAMPPKEFLLEKQPKTDVERVACLAYYLTHYRDTPHFKTLELSKLNTEAAQPKFSNAANSTNNAVKRGYLAASLKGQKQLSAAGEQFVRALPDREAARIAMTTIRPRRRSKKAHLSRIEKPE